MNDVGNLHETGLVLQKCKKPSPGIFQVSYFDDKTGRFFHAGAKHRHPRHVPQLKIPYSACMGGCDELENALFGFRY